MLHRLKSNEAYAADVCRHLKHFITEREARLKVVEEELVVLRNKLKQAEFELKKAREAIDRFELHIKGFYELN